MINSIMFPAPKSTYSQDSFSNYLKWIPRDFQDITDDKIPSLIVQYEGSPLWMIYSHGNACDIGDMFQELQKYSESFGVNVIAFEYQGYGICDGNPTADHCKADHLIVVDFLIRKVGVKSKDIIFFGRSIGTGIASYACRKTETKEGTVGGLILQSAYYNIREIAKEMVGTVGIFSPNPLDNASNLKRIKAPLLLIHGERDDVIPCKQSKELFEVAVSPYKKCHYPGLADHNAWDYQNDIEKPIKMFFTDNFKEASLEVKQYNIPNELLGPPPINLNNNRKKEILNSM